MHKSAVDAKLAADKKQRNEQSPIEKGLQKMDEKTLQSMDKLFQTAFYLAWKERPFTDFLDLLDLQTLNGVGLWGTYHNDKAAKEFINHIAGVYRTIYRSICINQTTLVSTVMGPRTGQEVKRKW